MDQNPYSTSSETQSEFDLSFSGGAEFDREVRTIQIIAGALITGVLMFFGVVILISQGAVLGRGGPSLITIMGAGFAGVMIVAHLMLPSVIRRAQMHQLSGQDVDNVTRESRISTLLPLYRTEMIVTFAVLEGAAFFNLIALLIDGHAASLIVVVLLLMMMLVKIPSKTRVTWWLQDRLSD